MGVEQISKSTAAKTLRPLFPALFDFLFRERISVLRRAGILG
jgi:hypothetical protein